MSYWRRLHRSWVWSRACGAWLLLGILPLAFFQTAIHEGSHCVMMEVTGFGCRVYAPFAVTLSQASVYGATFADAEGVEASVPTFVAPQVLAALLVVALRLAMRAPRREAVTLVLRLWLLGACADLLNNTQWRPQGGIGDWSLMANTLGLSPRAVLAVSLPAWALVAWGLLGPLPAPLEPRAAKVRDLWQIGVVYAAISALAVTVSTAVNVPDADPTTLWHQVPILLQGASVVVCLAVVAASRLTKSRLTRSSAGGEAA